MESTRIPNFNIVCKLVLGLFATSKRSHEVLSTAARDDQFYTLSNLIREFSKVLLNYFHGNSSGFNVNHSLFKASMQ